MAQRGRKSEHSLQVVPLVPGRSGRPPPPPELDAVEARIWHAVIDALPGFWVAMELVSWCCAAWSRKLRSRSDGSSGSANCGRRTAIAVRRPTPWSSSTVSRQRLSPIC